jgi:transcriptional regulator with XRE-family HTH domain
VSPVASMKAMLDALESTRSTPPRRDVGRVVKRLREKRGWSQSQLAREAKVSQGLVSMLEAGQHTPTALTILKLAVALGVAEVRLLR